ncbi:PIG-L deacetylase family protein [Candidatus Entotheonella palauensis]|uniref:PIG-L deacetylase family protein n=1 Tax=Candidatus Entotheonella palauensis TaxID=93172 RepID=UPI000B7EF84B|nr:PIG-L deacetylase family protein [Candidatus Entotheonella palauensis]
MKNILFVGAHHDDLELAIGGSVKRWVEEGGQVFCATLTDSTWTGPDGTRYRDPEQVQRYCLEAARVLGYTQIDLKYGPCFTLTYSDDKVVDLLNIIRRCEVDTLVAIDQSDAHKDHRVASEVALAAARELPRVLLTRVSWHSTPEVFQSRYFVDITRQFEAKRAALQCYRDEYERVGPTWERLVQAQATLYGLQAGCTLAEGFDVVKFLH